MILFIRDNECFEPRVKNYFRYFQENEIEYRVIGWNRNGKAEKDEHIVFYDKPAEYGKRIANIPKKIGWMLFVIKEIIKNRKECDAIHACDIDAILPALLIGKLLRKKIIFDIFDWISSLTGKGTVYKIVEFLQNYAYKHADAVILCEEERRAQAKVQAKQTLVLPNIPDAKTVFDKKALDMVAEQRTAYDYTVSYVGVFDRDRGLENLLQSVATHQNVLLNIAGFGVLGTLVEQYASQYPNIVCWGRVEYAVGQAIMQQSDMIAAMYHLTSPLHKYAAPNKYYESLLLQVPMITTENTLVGEKAKKYDTGFVLNETQDALDNLFETADLKTAIITKSQNCKKIWETVYAQYYSRFMVEQYLPLML